jgi:hypothetical protein
MATLFSVTVGKTRKVIQSLPNVLALLPFVALQDFNDL